VAFEIVRPRRLLISEYSASDAVRTNRMIRRSVRTSIDLGQPERGEDWPFVGVERYFWMVSLTVDFGTLRTLEICRSGGIGSHADQRFHRPTRISRIRSPTGKIPSRLLESWPTLFPLLRRQSSRAKTGMAMRSTAESCVQG